MAHQLQHITHPELTEDTRPVRIEMPSSMAMTLFAWPRAR
ncbi:hypothetical protein L499_A3577 [Bordetella holmesii CDC-H635-BH]|nr:hypothetical protein D560_1920 [Bordetella holmesii ATCC 51541]AIT26575.1 hypothetical protein D558_1905 [Bordetella holmesii 44057]EWM44221.1 hypothetical protein D556_1917 [Bordetella holmesii 41130]KAK79616.1 hypothetical protein L503_3579 [Bordetella holmesii CDC-H809-BH]KAL02174.1 hypothetical protein L499_A3577 [Bordetella holmesii CDC-H635-BH]KCV11202.1 hypothetical protein AZ25_2867 [Bordetella holmesii 04P3421]